MAIAVVLATLVVSGTALAADPDDKEEDDPALLNESEGATDTLSADPPVYCRIYGWPPTPYCVI